MAVNNNKTINQDAEEDFDDIRDAAIAKRASEAEAIILSRSPDIVVPDIPDDKTHHLFISHAEEDTEWAEALINVLEVDKGLKCLWYKRDFQAGRTIISSIDKSMACCMKSLFIITPAFLQSDWCLEEIKLAAGLSMYKRKCLVVPLLLKNCDMPPIFKTFHYIDVPRGEDYVYRIVRSFEPEDDLERMEASKVEFIPQKGSGLSICIYAEQDKQLCGIGTAWTFQEVQPNQKEKVSTLGSKFAENVFMQATEIVNDSVHLKLYFLRHSTCLCVIFTVCVMALCALFFVLSGAIILFSTRVFEKTNYLYIGLVTTTIGIPVAILVFQKLSYSKTKNRIVKLSVDHVKDTKVLVYCWNLNGKPCIQVMYYDIGPCLDYIAKTLTENMKEDMEQVDIVQAKTQARLDAESKALSYLRKNMKEFMLWKRARNSTIRRHPTYLNRMCLCERIET